VGGGDGGGEGLVVGLPAVEFVEAGTAGFRKLRSHKDISIS
jgi:hypothetical protein